MLSSHIVSWLEEISSSRSRIITWLKKLYECALIFFKLRVHNQYIRDSTHVCVWWRMSNDKIRYVLCLLLAQLEVFSFMCACWCFSRRDSTTCLSKSLVPLSHLNRFVLNGARKMSAMKENQLFSVWSKLPRNCFFFAISAGTPVHNKYLRISFVFT